MDLATGLGLLAGTAVVFGLVFLGGDLRTFYDLHAVIVIFGGVSAATLIRYPFTAMLHGLPLGIRFAFSMRSIHPRELIEEITKIADIVRKSGPMALETVELSDPFLGQGVRYVADGYDKDFIKEAMERDRDIFLMHLDEGQKIYRAIGDCAPAWGMIGTLIGMVQMFANMSDPSKLGPFMAISLLATLYGALAHPRDAGVLPAPAPSRRARRSGVRRSPPPWHARNAAAPTGVTAGSWTSRV